MVFNMTTHKTKVDRMVKDETIDKIRSMMVNTANDIVDKADFAMISDPDYIDLFHDVFVMLIVENGVYTHA